MTQNAHRNDFRLNVSLMHGVLGSDCCRGSFSCILGVSKKLGEACFGSVHEGSFDFGSTLSRPRFFWKLQCLATPSRARFALP